MNLIHAGQMSKNEIGNDTVSAMLRFRKRVFADKLSWEVDTQDEMERDDYDALDPLYLVAESETRGVCGCMRVLPSTGPMMVSDTFGFMLNGVDAPHDPSVWEISRLAVLPSEQVGTGRGRVNLCPITMGLFRTAYDVARERGIQRYIFVTSVGLERLLRRLGMPVSRFGTGKAQRIGDVLSVVLWVDINDQFYHAVYGPQVQLTAREMYQRVAPVSDREVA
ncbi:MAG: acyl-homoserine-lactone synthase [Gammaproteobacteria bacterium]